MCAPIKQTNYLKNNQLCDLKQKLFFFEWKFFHIHIKICHETKRQLATEKFLLSSKQKH